MISIILPIRNEKQSIANTLDSILTQSGKEYEIIVSDGMSTEGTREIIKSFQEKNDNIQLIDNHEQIVSTGFNRALSIAKGDVIIRVDGHSEIDPSFLQKCILSLKETGADCVGGSTTHIAKGIIGKSIVLAQSSTFGVGGVSFRKKVDSGQYVDTLAFGAYKREVFEKLGGYDEELVRNQDDEFNFRLIQSGGKIWLDPSIKSSYTPRSSFIGLIKQYFQYGFYKIRVMQKRRGFASWRHLVPGLFVSSLLLSFFFYFQYENSISLKLILIPYIGISLGFTLSSFFKSTKDITSILLLPVTFFILHFSYGLGFIFGFFYFLKKWNDRGVIDTHFDRETFKKNTENF